MKSRIFLISIAVISAVSSSSAPQNASVMPPQIHARAAIVIDAATGKALFEKNPDNRLPPASTTKIMTAMLFSRKVPPQQSITASPLAASMPGSRLGMTPGEKFKQQDILHAMLLISANDASVAAAEAASGNASKFVAEMNAEAKRLGAPNTHFTNPHGLQNPEHYSTARDLANIARSAMNIPEFREAVKQRNYKIPHSGNKPPHSLKNTDDLLWSYPGAEGIKTGWTRAAGLCFVGSAKRGSVRVITVLLHSPKWQQETAALMNYGFAAMGGAASSNAQSQTPAESNPSTHSGINQEKTPGLSRANSLLPDKDVSDADADLASAQELKSPGSSEEASRLLKKTSKSGADGSPLGVGSSSSRSVIRSDYLEPPQSHKTPASPVQVLPRLPQNQAPIDASQNSGNSIPDSPHQTHYNWWWLLLLLLLLFRRERKHSDLISEEKQPSQSEPIIEKERDSKMPILVAEKPSDDEGTSAKEMPDRVNTAPMNITVSEIMRRTGSLWCETIVDDPIRLLESMILREAKAFLEAEPDTISPAMINILLSPNIKIRLAAAEMLSGSAPCRVEAALQSILDTERPGSDTYEAAIQQLGSVGGDRFEKQAMQILLRESSPSAALALLNQKLLDISTTQELMRIINLPRIESQSSDSNLKSDLLRAYSASILLKHGHTDTDKMGECLHYLPEKSQERVICEMLSRVDISWTVDRLIQLALSRNCNHGVRELLNCRPETVQSVIEERRKKAPAVEQIHLDTLAWLVLASGNENKIRKLMDAGDSLAAEAFRLSEIYHPDISHLSSDAICAALQIVCLRLGYTSHSQAEVNEAFRMAAEDDRELAAIQPETLRLLAIAYTNEDVHRAVQFAIHQEDGKHLLLEKLIREDASIQIMEELAFWSGKSSPQTRIMLISALANYDAPVAQAALAARSQDPDSLIKSTALRALRIRNFGDFEEQIEESALEEQQDIISRAKAA